MRFPKPFPPALLVLAGFALRIADLGGQSYWVDEGISLDRIVQFPRWLLVDIHPPLYFIALAPWVKLTGVSEEAFRFPSVVWSVLTIPVVYLLGKRLFGYRAGLLAGLFQAVSAFSIAYAQEARMYALIALEIALVALLAARWFIDGDRRLVISVAYVAAAVAAMATHAFAAFCLLGLNATVAGIVLVRHLAPRGRLQAGSRPAPNEGAGRALGLARGRPLDAATRLLPPTLVRWGAMQFAAIGIFTPWLGVTVYQVANYPGREAPVPRPDWVLGNSWMAANLGLSLREHQAAPALAALLAVTILGALLLALKRPAARLPLVFLAGATLAPMVLYLLVLPSQPHYHPRYTLPLTSTYYVLLGSAVLGLALLSRPLAAFAGSAAAAAMIAGVGLYFFNAPYQKEEAREVAQSLAARAAPTEVIVADPVQPLQHYYQGPARLVQATPRNPLRELAELLPQQTGVWFVQWWQSTLDAEGQIPFLLAKYGRLDREERWRGYLVQHYSLPLPVGQVATQEDAQPVDVRFEPGLLLVSAGFGPTLTDRVDTEALASGGSLWAALRWRLTDPVTRDAKATVQLVDATGAPVAQADADLVLGIAGTRYWPPGQELGTYHILKLPAGLPPGRYELQASAYWKPTGPRLSPAPGPSTHGAVVVLGTIEIARTPAPRLPTPEEMPKRTEVAVGPEVTLLGHAARDHDVLPGNEAGALVYWRADASPAADYTARLVLRWPDGRVAFVGPTQPLAAEYPTRDWGPGEIIRSFLTLRISGDVQSGWYMLSTQVVRDGVPGQLIDLAAVQVLPTPAESVPTAPPRAELRASLGDAIRLLGYDLESDHLDRGGTVRLALHWTAVQSIPTSYTVFAQVLDSSSRVVAQHDALPANGTRPTSGWRVGDVVLDRHSIELPPSLPPGRYRLQIGMYDLATMQRVPIQTATAQVIDDALQLGPLTVRG